MTPRGSAQLRQRRRLHRAAGPGRRAGGSSSCRRARPPAAGTVRLDRRDRVPLRHGAGRPTGSPTGTRTGWRPVSGLARATQAIRTSRHRSGRKQAGPGCRRGDLRRHGQTRGRCRPLSFAGGAGHEMLGVLTTDAVAERGAGAPLAGARRPAELDHRRRDTLDERRPAAGGLGPGGLARAGPRRAGSGDLRTTSPGRYSADAEGGQVAQRPGRRGRRRGRARGRGRRPRRRPLVKTASTAATPTGPDAAAAARPGSASTWPGPPRGRRRPGPRISRRALERVLLVSQGRPPGRRERGHGRRGRGPARPGWTGPWAKVRTSDLTPSTSASNRDTTSGRAGNDRGPSPPDGLEEPS